MEEKHKLAEELNLAQSLQILATAYEEISVMKMRIARDSVLHTRDFLSALSEVFINVKSSYLKKQKNEHNKGKDSTDVLQFSTHKTNGQKVFVLLSATNKLYGDIVYKTFQLFKNSLQKPEEVAIVIVGKTGKEMYTAAFPQKKYTYFDLPDIVPNVETLKPIISYILQYEHVTIFYGRFVNVVTQEAIASSISGDEPLKNAEENGDTHILDQQKYGFIFEPSLETLLNFFETQIFSSLFKQTIAEEELARLASRIKAMEQAIVFINTRIDGLTTAQRRAKRQMENAKQLERVAGISLWKK